MPLVYTHPSLLDNETLSRGKGTLNCKRDLSLKKKEGKRIKKTVDRHLFCLSMKKPNRTEDE
jgi:hypothetical protein